MSFHGPDAYVRIQLLIMTETGPSHVILFVDKEKFYHNAKDPHEFIVDGREQAFSNFFGVDLSGLGKYKNPCYRPVGSPFLKKE